MTHSAKPIHVRFFVVSFVVIVSILLLTFLAAALSKTAHKPPSTRAVESPAPVRAVNAEEMQALLKRDGKRPLLVNYWATWCDPCRDEFPDLVKTTRYRAKGLDFIAITLDDLVDIKTAVPKFLLAMNAKMPVYLLNVSDPEPAINMVDRDGGALPATFLYDNNGKVVYKHFGRVNPGELRAAIEKLVGSKHRQQTVSSKGCNLRGLALLAGSVSYCLLLNAFACCLLSTVCCLLFMNSTPDVVPPTTSAPKSLRIKSLMGVSLRLPSIF